MGQETQYSLACGRYGGVGWEMGINPYESQTLHPRKVTVQAATKTCPHAGFLGGGDPTGELTEHLLEGGLLVVQGRDGGGKRGLWTRGHGEEGKEEEGLAFHDMGRGPIWQGRHQY